MARRRPDRLRGRPQKTDLGGPAMTRLESIADLRRALFHLRLLENLAIIEMGQLNAYREGWHQLLEQFYRENEDLMNRMQYRKAREDTRYFSGLVDLAYHYLKDAGAPAGSP
ncbi:MAG TPA: hypothetical protein DCS11_03160 [Syntrophus sp. (in: bacteria)]|nr:hypothetical protein [Syntrophus sp. (in: bacteria)]